MFMFTSVRGARESEAISVQQCVYLARAYGLVHFDFLSIYVQFDFLVSFVFVLCFSFFFSFFKYLFAPILSISFRICVCSTAHRGTACILLSIRIGGKEPEAACINAKSAF